MDNIQKLNNAKQALEKQLQEAEQQYREEVWEKQRLEILAKREAEENQRLRGFLEISSQTYKLIEEFLGEGTNPKLIWFLTALLENRSESYAAYGGGTLGGSPILNKKHLTQFIDNLEKSLSLKESK